MTTIWASEKKWKNYVETAKWSEDPYKGGFLAKVKNKIRDRDIYECCKCKIEESKHYSKYNQNLACHHIDFNQENNNLDNLITLCIPCHAIVHGEKREYYERILKNKIIIKKRLFL